MRDSNALDAPASSVRERNAKAVETGYKHSRKVGLGNLKSVRGKKGFCRIVRTCRSSCILELRDSRDLGSLTMQGTHS